MPIEYLCIPATELKAGDIVLHPTTNQPLNLILGGQPPITDHMGVSWRFMFMLTWYGGSRGFGLNPDDSPLVTHEVRMASRLYSVQRDPDFKLCPTHLGALKNFTHLSQRQAAANEIAADLEYQVLNPPISGGDYR